MEAGLQDASWMLNHVPEICRNETGGIIDLRQWWSEGEKRGLQVLILLA